MIKIDIERPQRDDVIKLHDFFDLVIRDTFDKNEIEHLRAEIQEEKTYKRAILREDFDTQGKKHYFLVAKSEGEIVGTIEYGHANEIVCNEVSEISDVIEVGTVFVHPNYQGLGIGRQMIEAIELALTKEGHSKYLMDSGYKSAQAVWTRKFGSPYKILENYWGEGDHHMIWMNEVTKHI